LVAEAELRFGHTPESAALDEFVAVDGGTRADGSRVFPFFPSHFDSDLGAVDGALLAARLERVRAKFEAQPRVEFRVDDFVRDDAPIEVPPEQQFDVIMCLSVTKWVHLNGGDDAVRRLFRKVFALLAPGGIFVLEAQPWSSYRKYRHLFPGREIAFHPGQFHAFLISPEVGFVDSKSHDHTQDGTGATVDFKRALTLYFKAGGAEIVPEKPQE
jgi:7SK snRNA methylphosphate capping enzyme